MLRLDCALVFANSIGTEKLHCSLFFFLKLRSIRVVCIFLPWSIKLSLRVVVES